MNQFSDMIISSYTKIFLSRLISKCISEFTCQVAYMYCAGKKKEIAKLLS